MAEDDQHQQQQVTPGEEAKRLAEAVESLACAAQIMGGQQPAEARDRVYRSIVFVCHEIERMLGCSYE